MQHDIFLVCMNPLRTLLFHNLDVFLDHKICLASKISIENESKMMVNCYNVPFGVCNASLSKVTHIFIVVVQLLLLVLLLVATRLLWWTPWCVWSTGSSFLTLVINSAPRLRRAVLLFLSSLFDYAKLYWPWLPIYVK